MEMAHARTSVHLSPPLQEAVVQTHTTRININGQPTANVHHTLIDATLSSSDANNPCVTLLPFRNVSRCSSLSWFALLDKLSPATMMSMKNWTIAFVVPSTSDKLPFVAVRVWSLTHTHSHTKDGLLLPSETRTMTLARFGHNVLAINAYTQMPAAVNVIRDNAIRSVTTPLCHTHRHGCHFTQQEQTHHNSHFVPIITSAADTAATFTAIATSGNDRKYEHTSTHTVSDIPWTNADVCNNIHRHECGAAGSATPSSHSLGPTR